MTLVLDLNPAQEHELQAQAERAGVPLNEYAVRRLFPAQTTRSADKPFRALQFAGIAPSGRTAEEVDADIDAIRDEWDERERAWHSITPNAAP